MPFCIAVEKFTIQWIALSAFQKLHIVQSCDSAKPGLKFNLFECLSFLHIRVSFKTSETKTAIDLNMIFKYFQTFKQAARKFLSDIR